MQKDEDCLKETVKEKERKRGLPRISVLRTRRQFQAFETVEYKDNLRHTRPH